MKRQIACVALVALLLSGCAFDATPSISLATLPANPTVAVPTIAPSTPPQASVVPTAEPATAAPSGVTPATTPLSPQASPTTPARPTAPLPAGAVAVVNGQLIRQTDYEREFAQAQVPLFQQPGLDINSEAGKQALQELREQVLNWMIDQVVIEQAAASLGITVTPASVEAELTRMRGSDQARFNTWLVSSGLTLDLLREQVRRDLVTTAVRDRITASLPRKMLQAHIRHILVSEETAAKAALDRLARGGNFISIAREVSEDDSTRANGGDLGFLPQGVMPPAFEKAAFTLKPGEISSVVRSEFGFHIIQMVEIDPDRPVPDDLWPMVQQRAFDDWLAQQRAKASIQIRAS